MPCKSIQDQRRPGAYAWRTAFGCAAQASSKIRRLCNLRTDTAAPSHCAPRPIRGARWGSLRGFTLIELMAVVALTGVLTSLALPSFEAQLLRARRSDALVSMMQLQGAQERWRSNGARYGSLLDIGASSVSQGGHYTLQVISADEDGYDMLATANGSQARDAGCRNLALRMVGANPVYASGPDAAVANSASLNARCWSL